MKKGRYTLYFTVFTGGRKAFDPNIRCHDKGDLVAEWNSPNGVMYIPLRLEDGGENSLVYYTALIYGAASDFEQFPRIGFISDEKFEPCGKQDLILGLDQILIMKDIAATGKGLKHVGAQKGLPPKLGRFGAQST